MAIRSVLATLSTVENRAFIVNRSIFDGGFSRIFPTPSSFRSILRLLSVNSLLNGSIRPKTVSLLKAKEGVIYNDETGNRSDGKATESL